MHSPCGFPNPTLEVTEQFWNVICCSQEAVDPSLDILGPSYYPSCQQLSHHTADIQSSDSTVSHFQSVLFQLSLGGTFPCAGNQQSIR